MVLRWLISKEADIYLLYSIYLSFYIYSIFYLIYTNIDQTLKSGTHKKEKKKKLLSTINVQIQLSSECSHCRSTPDTVLSLSLCMILLKQLCERQLILNALDDSDRCFLLLMRSGLIKLLHCYSAVILGLLFESLQIS